MHIGDNQDGWIFSFRDGRVQLIQIDFRLSFLVTDGPDKVWLHVETPGRLNCGAEEISLVPEQSVTLAPILALFNTSVNNIRIAKTGLLVIEFEQDRSIIVTPDLAYEA